MNIKKIAWLCFTVYFTACTPLALSKRDEIEILPSPLPSNYDNLELHSTILAQGIDLEKGLTWWESFESSDLNMLEQIALSESFDVLSALARLEQSKANARKVLGNSLPQISLDSSAARQIRTTQLSENGSQNSVESNDFNVGFLASYELDLWGKMTAERRAAAAGYEATFQDVRTANMSIAAAVAENWVDILSNQAELSVLERQITINKSLLNMQEVRFKNALAGSIDVLQQGETLAASLAERPALQQNTVAYNNSLAILLGKLPGDLPKFEQNASLPTLPPIPEVGLPIELLQLRPDVQAAFARLEAADLNVSIARANRLPSIKLSINQAFGAPETSLLFLNWLTNLMASLTAPIFDGGTLKAEEERARAYAEEMVQAYSKTVATALEEVNNAIVADVAQQNRLVLQTEQYDLAQKATDATLKAYLEGSDTFLRFITQLTASQNLERALVRQKANVLKARINLCKALGGLYFPSANQK